MTERAYRAVSIFEGKRYLIVDAADYGVCTSNLAPDELPIVRLRAEACPEKRNCISFRNGMSDICAFIQAYPILEGGIRDFWRLVCRPQKRNVERKVVFLGANGCPRKKGNCLGCASLAGAVIPVPGRIVKSHAHVVCTAVVS